MITDFSLQKFLPEGFYLWKVVYLRWTSDISAPAQFIWQTAQNDCIIVIFAIVGIVSASGFDQRPGGQIWTEGGRHRRRISAGAAEGSRWRRRHKSRGQRGVTVSGFRSRSLFHPVPAQTDRTGLVRSAGPGSCCPASSAQGETIIGHVGDVLVCWSITWCILTTLTASFSSSATMR